MHIEDWTHAYIYFDQRSLDGLLAAALVSQTFEHGRQFDRTFLPIIPDQLAESTKKLGNTIKMFRSMEQQNKTVKRLNRCRILLLDISLDEVGEKAGKPLDYLSRQHQLEYYNTQDTFDGNGMKYLFNPLVCAQTFGHDDPPSITRYLSAMVGSRHGRENPLVPLYCALSELDHPASGASPAARYFNDLAQLIKKGNASKPEHPGTSEFFTVLADFFALRLTQPLRGDYFSPEPAPLGSSSQEVLSRATESLFRRHLWTPGFSRYIRDVPP